MSFLSFAAAQNNVVRPSESFELISTSLVQRRRHTVSAFRVHAIHDNEVPLRKSFASTPASPASSSSLIISEFPFHKPMRMVSDHQNLWNPRPSLNLRSTVRAIESLLHCCSNICSISETTNGFPTLITDFRCCLSERALEHRLGIITDVL